MVRQHTRCRERYCVCIKSLTHRGSEGGAVVILVAGDMDDTLDQQAKRFGDHVPLTAVDLPLASYPPRGLPTLVICIDWQLMVPAAG